MWARVVSKPMNISVVIPLAENDESWKELMEDLQELNSGDEVIFVSYAHNQIFQLEIFLKKYEPKFQIQCLQAPKGRAQQMNFGARVAKNKIIWFLHSDSRLKNSAINFLKKKVQSDIRRIYFFRLKFLKDGSNLMKINNFGVWIRSELLRLPFGDQGFCMHRDTLKLLGGFCETTIYGEDHLLIWAAHQKNIRISCIGIPLYTSSRKYKSNGWFNTTLKHLYLTYRQAVPEFFKLIGSKVML